MESERKNIAHELARIYTNFFCYLSVLICGSFLFGAAVNKSSEGHNSHFNFLIFRF
jgi:hypothetical protein